MHSHSHTHSLTHIHLHTLLTLLTTVHEMPVAIDCMKQVFPLTESHVTGAPRLEDTVGSAQTSSSTAPAPPVDVEEEALKLKTQGLHKHRVLR